jgi:para-nitrobenzyl esterase
MKTVCLITAILTACPCMAAPVATFAANETQPYYSTARSTLGELVDNPATRAILARYLPEIVNSPHLNQARRLTLKGMQPLAPDLLTDEKLAKIDEELSKVPPPAAAS